MRIPIKVIVGIIVLAALVYLAMVFDIFRVSPKDDVSVTTQTDEQSAQEMIRVNLPTSGALISSPVTISGEARGTWYFEASFPVKIIDAAGAQVGVGYAQAKGDWMTENFVPFEAKVYFNTSTSSSSTAASSTGIIRLEKDNPSGLPEKDAYVDLPVIFSN